MPSIGAASPGQPGPAAPSVGAARYRSPGALAAYLGAEETGPRWPKLYLYNNVDSR